MGFDFATGGGTLERVASGLAAGCVGAELFEAAGFDGEVAVVWLAGMAGDEWAEEPREAEAAGWRALTAMLGLRVTGVMV